MAQWRNGAWTCRKVAKLASQEPRGHKRILILDPACTDGLEYAKAAHLAVVLKGFPQPALSTLPPHTLNTCTHTLQDTACQPPSVQPCTQRSHFLTLSSSATYSVRRARSLSHTHTLVSTHTHAGAQRRPLCWPQGRCCEVTDTLPAEHDTLPAEHDTLPAEHTDTLPTDVHLEAVHTKRRCTTRQPSFLSLSQALLG